MRAGFEVVRQVAPREVRSRHIRVYIGRVQDLGVHVAQPRSLAGAAVPAFLNRRVRQLALRDTRVFVAAARDAVWPEKCFNGGSRDTDNPKS